MIPGAKASFLTVKSGGISETKLQLHLGLTGLERQSATNPTSILQMVMAGLELGRAFLKDNTDEG